MITDIKRATEIYICDKLAAELPTHRCVPFTGGSNTLDADLVEPPFTVVIISEAQRTHSTEGTWFLRGTVQVITHAADVGSAEHSTLVRNVYKAFGAIEPDWSNPLFSLHGIDIDKMRSAEDSESQAHSDIIDFTAGVGG